jgi:2-phospho-L-lactate/phosphoenolpyruvate guanylyltransferase
MLGQGENENGRETAAVIPVKRLESAHERLSAVTEPADRARLAEAMFLDLLTKLRRSKTIDEVIVVTADETVARNARWLGHEVLVQPEDCGHSEAAAAGARMALARGFQRVAMLPIDCPLFDPAELDDRLGQTPRAALIVPDRHGTGTNALVLSPPDAFAPAFGPDSCARHVNRARSAGVGFALEQIESLALDLDTPEDFTELRDALIVSPERALRTAKVLWDLGAEPEPAAV